MLDLILTIASLSLPLAAALGLYLAGKRSGKDRAETDAQKQDLEAINHAKETENRVAAMSDADVADKLRDRWTR